MSSGVKVAKACTEEFDDLKMKKNHRYIIFRLSDNQKEIVVDHKGERGESYETFVAKLLEKAGIGCRFAVFDLDFTFNGKPKDKLLFIAWAPENAPIKSKMIYTTSKDYLKKALNLSAELQATDADEISLESATELARKNAKA